MTLNTGLRNSVNGTTHWEIQKFPKQVHASCTDSLELKHNQMLLSQRFIQCEVEISTFLCLRGYFWEDTEFS